MVLAPDILSHEVEVIPNIPHACAQSSRNPLLNKRKLMDGDTNDPGPLKKVATEQGRRRVPAQVPVTPELPPADTLDHADDLGGIMEWLGQRQTTLISPPPSRRADYEPSRLPMSLDFDAEFGVEDSPRNTSAFVSIRTKMSQNMDEADVTHHWGPAYPILPITQAQAFSSCLLTDTLLNTASEFRPIEPWKSLGPSHSSRTSYHMQSVQAPFPYQTRVDTATDTSTQRKKNSDASTLGGLDYLLRDVQLAASGLVSRQGSDDD